VIGKDIKTILYENEELIEAITESIMKQIEIVKNHVSNYYNINIQSISDKSSHERGYFVIFNNITKQFEAATQDGLTNIYNRKYFTDRSKHEIERSLRYDHSVSLIMFDIDNFKKVNDSYGHLAGDEVIKHLSNVALRNIRSTDILGRYGGDEFVILLPETDIESCEEIAQRILLDFTSSAVNYNNYNIKATTSFGIANTRTANTDNLESLMEYADKALYMAKNAGRNCIKAYM
jgi:diguanylate cyclase (GGDEF)-like protein